MHLSKNIMPKYRVAQTGISEGILGSVQYAMLLLCALVCPTSPYLNVKFYSQLLTDDFMAFFIKSLQSFEDVAAAEKAFAAAD